MKRVPRSKSHAKKLDGRRMNAHRAVQKRATAKRQGRGADLVIHGTIKSKRDPFLQQRIDAVVAKALSGESGHCTDVINGFHTLRFHSSGLKCHKVG